MSAVQQEPFSHRGSAGACSLLAALIGVRGRTSRSLVGERGGRKGNQATWANTWGSARTLLNTDVSAAETARKQASTVACPLFFFLSLALFCFSFSCCSPVYSVCFMLSFSFSLALRRSLCLSSCHLDVYSKIKRGLKGNFERSQPLMSLVD